MLFIFGNEGKDVNSKTKHKLLKEQDTHGDIIQVKGLVEHYNNLTLKTLYTLKFFLDKGWYRL